MDALTHVCLPLTVAVVARTDLFPDPRYLLVGAFGLAPDADKYLGVPGVGHSLLTVVPLCLLLVGLDRWWRGDATYGTLAAALVLSHLLLDFVDGSGVYALAPLVDAGIGLAYPGSIVFGEGLLGVRLDGLPVALDTKPAPVGFRESTAVTSNGFGFVNSFGVAATLTFLGVYAALDGRLPGSAGRQA